MPCNFLLKARHAVLGKRNTGRKAIGDMEVRHKEREGIIWFYD